MTIETERTRTAGRVLQELQRLTLADDLDSEAFRGFAEAVLGRVRGTFLAEHPARQVIRYLEVAFRFVAERLPGEVHVAVRSAHRGRGLLVTTHMEDQPFLVDTVRLFLKRGGAEWWSGFHVILPIERNAEGRYVAVREGAPSESVILVEASVGELGDVAAAGRALQHALELARSAVADFRPMTRAVERFVELAEARAERRPHEQERWSETAAFLSWLLRDNFVFMGVRSPAGAFGIEATPGPYQGTPEGAWPEPHAPGTVWVRKGTVDAPIHRHGRMDEILVRLDPADALSEALLVRGLFTFRAVSQPTRNVPILRGVLARLLAEQEAVKGSFRYKGIANVFDSLPTEFLFATPSEAVARMVEHVLDSETAQEVGVTVIRHGDGSAFCLVSMPKPFYSEELRREVEAVIVSTLQPRWHDHGLFVGRFDSVLLNHHLTGIADVDDAVLEAMTDQIRAVATPWTSRLWEEFARRLDVERADALLETWGRALPEAYTRHTPVGRALEDLQILSALTDADPVRADLFEDASGRVVLRFYQRHDVSLTRLLPVVDHVGLTVLSADAATIATDQHTYTLDTFFLEVEGEGRSRLFAHRQVLLDTLPVALAGRVDDDAFNALVLTAGLTWQQVDVIRGLSRYMRQLHVNVSQPQLQAIVLSRPELVALLVEVFSARFDPDLPGDRGVAMRSTCEAAEVAIRRLGTHDEDVVFGGLYNLILAMERTNAFRDDRVRHYLSFKFDAARVRDLRGNRPLYEIYVHAPEVEGVHLRFGKVARGGLRWSDRADYRTEVLALVTTQQIKNVVIVPEGAKGGFYVRRPAKPEERRAQADELYEVFVRALLDLTDNQVNGAVVPPPRVVRHDGDDPYLVVAADKGTAHLSDTANRLSAAYGYWLGDAFASGGSNGYDHKEVGITARGGWVLVKRHFIEMGRDPYAEPFTCVGIGDLGGDVFGNGLIESRHTRLLAAFNHQHVFLDPDPDAELSFVERRRLFDAGGRAGGWDQYDKAVISAGGGVWERAGRSIPLSLAAREMLGLDVEEAAPDVVCRAILCMNVDLLWSGGIGTYVKATAESHADVDDRANDRFRVSAPELRCKVVGEGANLSLTQAARVEAALHGVRLNADFVDNSGGVDLSDHEVNLKILLQGPVARGHLSEVDRNTLLQEMTDEVARLVLADNDVQGRQLSRDHLRSQQDVYPFGRAIAFVERHFGVARADLVLPSDGELARRAAAGIGLTRPELAMLAAYVKRWVFGELLRSGRARELDPDRGLLRRYFPKVIQERFLADIDGHALADEITITQVTTRIVGDAGAAFVPLVVESTGRSVADVAIAYLKAQQLARADDLRAALEQQRASVAMRSLTQAWLRVDNGCREVVWYWLSPGGRAPTDAELAEMAPAVEEVVATDAEEVLRRNAAVVAQMAADGVPEPVARLVIRASYLDEALRVWWQARRVGAKLRDTSISQFAALRATRLQEVLDALRTHPASGRWEPIAVQVLANRFGRLARELVLRVGVREASSVEVLEPELRTGLLAEARAQVDNLLTLGERPDLATLTVLEERLEGAIRRLPEPKAP